MKSDLKVIVFFLIFAFFVGRFFLIPAARCIASFVKFLGVKRQIKKLGRKVLEIDAGKKMGKFFYIYSSTAICLITVYSILVKRPLGLLLNLFFMTALLDSILAENYSKYNGFYENGMIFGSFIEWNDIFSWKKVGDDKISFLGKDGIRFDVETKSIQNEAIDFLISKAISEEK